MVSNKDRGILCGCITRDGEEIDGEEFEVSSLRELIEIFKKNKEVHLNYFDADTKDIDLWLKIS